MAVTLEFVYFFVLPTYIPMYSQRLIRSASFAGTGGRPSPRNTPSGFAPVAGWFSRNHLLLGTGQLCSKLCPLFYSRIPKGDPIILFIFPHYSHFYSTKSCHYYSVQTVKYKDRFFPTGGGFACILRFRPRVRWPWSSQFVQETRARRAGRRLTLRVIATTGASLAASASHACGICVHLYHDISSSEP